jgi:predicted aspartyl protease
VKETRFDPNSDLVIVRASVWGRHHGEATPLSLALDTGSSETVIRASAVDDLGSSARDGEAITTVRAALGNEHGYTLRVARFAALGYAVPEFRVHVFDLAEGFGIDGLLGLSFLRQFNYTIRSEEGRLLVEPVAAVVP